MFDFARWFQLAFTPRLTHTQRLAAWHTPGQQQELWSDPRTTAQVEQCLLGLERFTYIPCVSSDYPAALQDLEDRAPWGLWCLGDTTLLRQPVDAIVGTRKATPHGLEMAAMAAQASRDAGRVVVSGGALGIDAGAHRAALPATVAVMAGGLQHLTPPAHTELFKAIAADGLILSEMPPWFAPVPGLFPRRNRLIAALAQRVLVVEAELRSGSLITAEWALTLGRDLYAVPGHPLYSGSQGTNQLLLDGAQFFLGPEDWSVQWAGSAPAGIESTLRQGPMTVADLSSNIL